MQEIALSDNLQQIELEINWHKENAGKSIWEIGRRLNHVKENDLAHGEFGQWLEKIEINQRVANQFMKVASEIPNSSTYSNLGYNALYLIATLPEEEKQAQLERVEQGDNPTVRELQEVRRKLKESEERNKRLEERYWKPKTKRSIWSPSYYVESIGAVNEQAVAKYIDDQRKKEV
jgi:REP element-mobilizing transposase RayT